MTNEEFVKASKALSDLTKVEILKIISKAGTICACKILEELHITQGTLSHHMKVLTDLRLVSVEKTGKWCNYTLIRENICEIAHFVQDICAEKETKSCSCSCK
jgi:ArsR family transcriptional regulator